MMKAKYIQYANKLDTIGDLIISISNLIRSPDTVKIMSHNDVIDYKKELNETIKSYEYAEGLLLKVNAPFIVQNQHKRLVESFGQFIESIRVINSSFSLNIDECIFNERQYLKGLAMQEASVKQIGKLTQLIGDILLK